MGPLSTRASGNVPRYYEMISNGIMSDYARWLDAFQLAYRAPTLVSEVECPECGFRELQAAVCYLARRHRSGQCGVLVQPLPNRHRARPGPRPESGQRVPREGATIPAYRIVPPPG